MSSVFLHNGSLGKKRVMSYLIKARHWMNFMTWLATKHGHKVGTPPSWLVLHRRIDATEIFKPPVRPSKPYLIACNDCNMITTVIQMTKSPRMLPLKTSLLWLTERKTRCHWRSRSRIWCKKMTCFRIPSQCMTKANLWSTWMTLLMKTLLRLSLITLMRQLWHLMIRNQYNLRYLKLMKLVGRFVLSFLLNSSLNRFKLNHNLQ